MNNRNQGVVRTVSSSAQEDIIRWFKEEQLPLRAGYQKTSDTIAPWFHGECRDFLNGVSSQGGWSCANPPGRQNKSFHLLVLPKKSLSDYFHKAVFQRRLSKLHSHDCLEGSQHSRALCSLWDRFIATNKTHRAGGKSGIPGDLPLGCLIATSIKWPHFPSTEGDTVMGVGRCWIGRWLSNLEQIIVFFCRKPIYLSLIFPIC